MPFLKIQTTEELLDANLMMSKASELLANILGKPEKYIMLTLEETATMLFGGINKPAIFCELKSIGLPGTKTKEISEKLCRFLSDETGVSADRIYIEFSNVERNLWGWNGATFEK